MFPLARKFPARREEIPAFAGMEKRAGMEKGAGMEGGGGKGMFFFTLRFA